MTTLADLASVEDAIGRYLQCPLVIEGGQGLSWNVSVTYDFLET
jgi:hypothetical protein